MLNNCFFYRKPQWNVGADKWKTRLLNLKFETKQVPPESIFTGKESWCIFQVPQPSSQELASSTRVTSSTPTIQYRTPFFPSAIHNTTDNSDRPMPLQFWNRSILCNIKSFVTVSAVYISSRRLWFFLQFVPRGLGISQRIQAAKHRWF